MPPPHQQQQAILLGLLTATATAVGMALGYALAHHMTKRKDDNDADQRQVGEDAGDTTNVVRLGLAANDSSSSSTPSTPSAAIRIPQTTLESFVAAIMMKITPDIAPANAQLVASVLAYADSRGIPSHGVNRLDTYLNEIEAGLVDCTAVPHIVQKQDASTDCCCAVVDGRNALGAVVAHIAVTEAIRLADQHGIGMVACYHSNHYGAAGYWAEMALSEGYIGISMTNTSPIVVPTGGSTKALGTNPIAFFAPAASPSTSMSGAAFSAEESAGHTDSFQLDMATSIVPIGKVEVLDRLGKPVPNGWGVDRNGKPSQDAHELCRFGGLSPLGGGVETAGYKGYGLAMMVEILTSLLSGATSGPHVQPWIPTRADPLNYGHCFLVIDPRRFVVGFENRLRQFLQAMRSLPGDVMVAGDPEKEYERQSRQNGILLHPPVAALLAKLALRCRIRLPVELESIDTSMCKGSIYARP